MFPFLTTTCARDGSHPELLRANEFAQYAPASRPSWMLLQFEQDSPGFRTSRSRRRSKPPSRSPDVHPGGRRPNGRRDGRRSRRPCAEHPEVGIPAIDPTTARIVLVDMAPRVLPTFSKDLSEAANRRLQKLGVEVRLGHSVDNIDADGITVAGERIVSKTVIWTAALHLLPQQVLNVDTDRAGRVRVQPDLSVPGHSEVFVVGDTASLDRNGMPLPESLKCSSTRQIRGQVDHKRIAGGPAPKPFKYFDKGNMAVVGKGFAVLQTGKNPFERLLSLACMGGRASAVPGNLQSARERVPPVDLDLYHGSEGIASDRKPSRIRQGTRSAEAPLGLQLLPSECEKFELFSFTRRKLWQRAERFAT